MKRVFILLTGIGFSVVTNAQFRDTVFVVPKEHESNFIALSMATPKGKLLAENNLGKVYSLPLDNMRCLVPNTKNTIPIPTKKLYLQKGSIPNSSPR
jgi:hypothetical protein